MRRLLCLDETRLERQWNTVDKTDLIRKLGPQPTLSINTNKALSIWLEQNK